MSEDDGKTPVLASINGDHATYTLAQLRAKIASETWFESNMRHIPESRMCRFQKVRTEGPQAVSWRNTRLSVGTHTTVENNVQTAWVCVKAN